MASTSSLSNLSTALGPLHQRWSALSARERLLVTVAATVLGLALLVSWAVRPAWRTLQEAPQRKAQAQATIDQMQALATEALALRDLAAAQSAGTSGGAEPSGPQAGVDDATREQLLGVLGESTRVDTQDRHVTLSFEGVTGEQVRGAIMTVRSRLKVRLIEAELTPAEEGMRGRLRFEWLPG